LGKLKALPNRAFSVLTIKSADDDARIIRGIATSPSVDRVGDIIEPLGVKFANPISLLWQHKHDQPIGSVTFEKPTAKGIVFEATVAKLDEPGTLKDRLDEAWHSIKLGLVRAVSIGFRPIEYSYMDNGGIRYSTDRIAALWSGGGLTAAQQAAMHSALYAYLNSFGAAGF
jgi:hypothetical protein